MKGKTTISLEPEVAKALKYYMADKEMSFKEQSKAINELLENALLAEQEKNVSCPAL